MHWRAAGGGGDNRESERGVAEHRLLEVPPVDPAEPVQPLAPESTHERQLTDVFGCEEMVRYITSFV
jgi:hypothetical protein